LYLFQAQIKKRRERFLFRSTPLIADAFIKLLTSTVIINFQELNLGELSIVLILWIIISRPSKTHIYFWGKTIRINFLHLF
jgi:hypothetical protein